MKLLKLVPLCFFMSCLLVQAAEKESRQVSFAGRSPSPAIDRAGNMALLFLDGAGRLSFGRQDSPSGGFKIWKTEALKGEAYSPQLKEDRIGRLWAVWTEVNSSTSKILVGRLVTNGIRDRQVVSTSPDINFSPDLDFDSSNTAWTAWIVRTGKSFKVCVRDMAHGRTWTVSRPSLPSASQVRILAGGSSGPWVFWTGRSIGRDEIFVSRFDGAIWSKPARLNEDDSVPHLFLNTALDPTGRPWVIWSAYDGEDYEIYSSFWNGYAWTGEEKVTDNQACDVYPSLAFLEGPNPIMVWSRSQEAKNSICARIRETGARGTEKELYAVTNTDITDPRIAVRNGRLAVFWESGGAIRLKNLTSTKLAAKRSVAPSLRRAASAPEDPLDENAYIGFGDSITAGEINHDPAPELGYIPRLETLLNASLGPSTVINEGFPGENTVAGVVRIDEVLSKHAARYILLMEGTNDVISLAISPDTTAFNLEEMIRKCRDFGTFPILSSIIPRSDSFWERKIFRERILEINEKIDDIRLNLGVCFADMFNIFFNYSELAGGWRSLISDGVHPNETGYQIMALAWCAEIKGIPFSPSDISVARSAERSLFFIRELNILTWRHNLKISNPFRFRTYRIYRKDLTESPAEYRLLVTIPYSPFHNPQKYADLDIKAAHHYQYVISLCRDDMVEGPVSAAVNDSD